MSTAATTLSRKRAPRNAGTTRTPRPRTRPKSLHWPEFAGKLAQVLAAMSKDQYVVISTKQGNRYVQFARGVDSSGKPEVRAETTSNAFLAGAEKLGKRQLAMLADLGWIPPTHGKDDSPVANGSVNHHRDFGAPLDFALITRVAMATLVHVLGIDRPALLQYRSFQEPGGVDVTLPTLGIDKEPLPAHGEGFVEARAEVLAAIRKASKQPTVDYDADGDIPVRYGKALLFVNVVDSPRFARVYSVVVNDVVATEALFRRLNELNERARLVRLIHANGRVWASSDVFAHPLLPKHVVHACHVVGEIVNDLRESLQAEFGTKLVLEKPAPGELKN